MDATIKKNRHIVKRSVEYIILFIIPLIFICYFFYMSWLPFGFERTYSVNFGDGEDINEKNPVYLRDLPDRISEPIYVNNESYRYMIDSPWYINIIPPVAIDDNTTLSIKLDAITNSDLYITSTDYINFNWIKIIDINKTKNYGSIKTNIGVGNKYIVNIDINGRAIRFTYVDRNTIVIGILNKEIRDFHSNTSSFVLLNELNITVKK